MTKPIKHKHRVKPGYEGGEYVKDNVIELTPIQHAMWHYAEWQRKGRWQDKTAWRGLAGLITSDEATLEAIRNGGRQSKGFKHSEESKKRMSESKKGRPGHKHSEETKKKISKANRGKPKNPDSVKKHNDAISHNWIVIAPCGTVYEIRNLRAFCREYNLNQGAMNQVGLGKKKAYKGWTCRKKYD